MRHARRTSRQFFWRTSDTGAREMLRSATSLLKTGLSRMPSRMYRPIPTRTMLSRNGIRHPHSGKPGPVRAAIRARMPLARISPTGTPN
jgi:hypothetical protein